MRRSSGALMKVGSDRYRLACGKAALFVRLLGARKPVRFEARDHLVFRIDAENLTVEDRRTSSILNAFPWYRIESVAAGEPESDNSDLFQGGSDTASARKRNTRLSRLQLNFASVSLGAHRASGCAPSSPGGDAMNQCQFNAERNVPLFRRTRA